MTPLPHALILTGGSEEVRLSEAKTLSAALLCRERDGFACGACSSCRKAIAGGHPDVTFLFPEGREIVVAQVRVLRAGLRLAPHEGRRKVAVIQAGALNVHAQNALLNILEEPPGKSHFFLLSENPTLLLPTVRSRCATRRLPDPPAESLAGEESGVLLGALLSEDEWIWAQACLSLEKCPRDKLRLILDGLAARLVSALPERDILTARRFGGIIDQIRSLQDMLDANVGAGHVCGALAAAFASPGF